MNAARKKHRPKEARPADPAAPARESHDEEVLDAGDGDAPPHALWRRLDEWAGGRASRDSTPVKLPIAARVAIIVLLSIACWMVVIALIALI